VADKWRRGCRRRGFCGDWMERQVRRARAPMLRRACMPQCCAPAAQPLSTGLSSGEVEIYF